MADTPQAQLWFEPGCSDCGERRTKLPGPLPDVGDDFDWLSRDYDGYRLAMMEELAGRFPERDRWTPADIEVIFVEAFAVALDQLSDSLDRVHTEAYLDSARQPASVRRLLQFIGYDALRYHYQPAWTDAALVRHLLALQGFAVESLPTELAPVDAASVQALLLWMGFPANALGPTPDLGQRETERGLLQLMGYAADSLREAVDLELPDHRRFAIAALEREWRDNPHLMDVARQAGPGQVHHNQRMVTLADYSERLEDHPLVQRAASSSQWTGSWSTLQVTVVLAANGELDQAVDAVVTDRALADLQSAVDGFNWWNRLAPVDWLLHPSYRSLLQNYLDAYRMTGQEVWLCDARPVGLAISLSLRIADNYFQTEIRQAVVQVMGGGPGGFFEPGRLAFGEDLYASDLVEVLMNLDGVQAVCLNRFKRVGNQYPDQSGSGVIRLEGNQIGRCDNRRANPALGYWRLSLQGGQLG